MRSRFTIGCGRSSFSSSPTSFSRRRRRWRIGPAVGAVGGGGRDADESGRAGADAMPRGGTAEGVRTDIDILCDLGNRLGHRRQFTTRTRRLCSTSCDAPRAAEPPTTRAFRTKNQLDCSRAYSGPVPSLDHPGTPRLFADTFPTDNGRANFTRSRIARSPKRRRRVSAVSHDWTCARAVSIGDADAANARTAGTGGRPDGGDSSSDGIGNRVAHRRSRCSEDPSRHGDLHGQNDDHDS